ncbi:MAG: archaeosortase C [Archaeoglobaceae archaeon]
MLEYRNILIFLAVFALFLGATVEISEGSMAIGIILFAIALLLITRIRVTTSLSIKADKYKLVAGVGIILADIVYNLTTADQQLGTLDMMTFLLGVSLVAQGIPREDTRRMGVFGMYVSGIFIALFLVFFSLFNELNIDFTHIFDHYFVLLPSFYIIKSLGLPVQIISTETIRIQGLEDMTVVIGGPCSGLYSMFLLVAMVIAYSRIESIGQKKLLSLLGLTIAIAYIANLTRVTTLYLVAFYYGSEAMMTVHEHLGWIIFLIVVTAILYIISRVSPSAKM